MPLIAKPISEVTREKFVNVVTRPSKYRNFIDLKSDSNPKYKYDGNFQFPVLVSQVGFMNRENTNNDGVVTGRSLVTSLDLGKDGERTEDQQKIMDILAEFKENIYKLVTREYPKLAKVNKDIFMANSSVGTKERLNEEMDSLGYIFKLNFSPVEWYEDDPSGARHPSGKVKKIKCFDFTKLQEPMMNDYGTPLASAPKERMEPTVDAAKEFLLPGCELRVIAQIDSISVAEKEKPGFNLTWKVGAIVRVKQGTAYVGRGGGDKSGVVPGFNDDCPPPPPPSTEPIQETTGASSADKEADAKEPEAKRVRYTSEDEESD